MKLTAALSNKKHVRKVKIGTKFGNLGKLEASFSKNENTNLP